MVWLDEARGIANSPALLLRFGDEARGLGKCAPEGERLVRIGLTSGTSGKSSKPLYALKTEA